MNFLHPEVVQALEARRDALAGPVPERGERPEHRFVTGVKVLVGGYPFNVDLDLWRRIGADGCARDAAEAIELAKRLAAA